MRVVNKQKHVEELIVDLADQKVVIGCSTLSPQTWSEMFSDTFHI